MAEQVLQFKLDDPSYYHTIDIPLTEYKVTQHGCPVSSQVGPILLYVVIVCGTLKGKFWN